MGAPAGTVVRVEDLFFNVPARAKFVKSDATERRNIDAFCTRYALAYTDVRFQLVQEGRSVLNTSGNGDRREALASLYSPDIARDMLAVETAYENLQVEGFISPPSLTRANRSAITFFVNGRWVQDVALTTAFVQAYHSMLMVGRYPMGVLFIELPPEQVDVNVHPAKAEVRFANKNEIFSGVQRAVRRALLAYSPVPSVTTQIRWTPPTAEDIRRSAAASPTIDQPSQPDAEIAGDEPAKPSDAAPLPGTGMPLLRLVGQVGTAYIVAEGPDGLYLVDQHAAHERVLFERFMKQREKEIPSQALLTPVTVTLSAEESRLLEDQIPILAQLGFKVEPFGPNIYQMRAMPALLIGTNPEAALRVVIEDFEEDETPLQQRSGSKDHCARVQACGGKSRADLITGGAKSAAA